MDYIWSFYSFLIVFKTKYIFSNDVSAKEIVQDQKSIFSDTEKLTLMVSINSNFCSTILHFCDLLSFLDRTPLVFGFLISPRALLVQNASLLTPLYLGKNYPHRKRIVKHILKIHFSTQKNVILGPPANCQPSHWRGGS